MSIQSSSVVGDVMRRFPATIRVFLDFKLRCVGCPIAPFHTVRDACREHVVNEAELLGALRAGASSFGLGPHAAPPSASA